MISFQKFKIAFLGLILILAGSVWVCCRPAMEQNMESIDKEQIELYMALYSNGQGAALAQEDLDYIRQLTEDSYFTKQVSREIRVDRSMASGQEAGPSRADITRFYYCDNDLYAAKLSVNGGKPFMRYFQVKNSKVVRVYRAEQLLWFYPRDKYLAGVAYMLNEIYEADISQEARIRNLAARYMTRQCVKVMTRKNTGQISPGVFKLRQIVYASGTDQDPVPRVIAEFTVTTEHSLWETTLDMKLNEDHKIYEITTF